MPRDALLEAPTMFRSTVLRAAPKGIDREAGTISGFAVITVGEALGHDLWIDEVFLEQLEAADRAAGDKGFKSRFTHPGLSSDGLGKFLGRSRQLYRDGDLVRGVLSMSRAAEKSPDGNLPEYVFALAEEDPEAFGTSIVFERDRDSELRFMEANTQEREGEGRRFRSPDPRNKNNFRHARLSKLRCIDVVDEPAANPGGMFSAGEELASRAEALLSFAFGITGAAPDAALIGIEGERARTFLRSFLERHKLQIQAAAASPAKETSVTIEKKIATLAELKSRFGQAPAFVLEQLEAGADMATAESAWNKLQAAELAQERKQLAEERAAMERERAELRALPQRTKADDLAEGFGAPMERFATPMQEQPVGPSEEQFHFSALGFESQEALDSYLGAAERGRVSVAGF